MWVPLQIFQDRRSDMGAGRSRSNLEVNLTNLIWIWHKIGYLVANYRKLHIWPTILPYMGFMAKYPDRNGISGQISFRTQDIWPNILIDTGYLANYPPGYGISGQLSSWIRNIWATILLDTDYMGNYPPGYGISGQLSSWIRDIWPTILKAGYPVLL